MCNRFGYLAPVSRLVDEFNRTRLPLLFKDGTVPNLERWLDLGADPAFLLTAGEAGTIAAERAVEPAVAPADG